MEFNIVDNSHHQSKLYTLFSPAQIRRISKNSKNLEALKGLLLPLAEGSESTYLSQLTQAGFTLNNLVTVLGHIGGFRNLEALKGLLLPLAEGSESTYLSQLTQAGFTLNNLVTVLGNHGGYRNLDALIGLLLPLTENSESTYLSLLTKAGFTRDNLVKVLGHGGGAKNLDALIGLLLPLTENSESTYLSLLTKAGFTSENLVKVLGHSGGSMGLDVLKGLLLPLIENSESTYLSLLTKAGFTCGILVAILGRDGGTKNLDALFNLLTNISISDFISSHPGAHDSLISLANRNSKSVHIAFLADVLSKEDLRIEIRRESLLLDLLLKIKTCSSKTLTELQLNCIDDLKEFCEKKTTKNLPPQNNASEKEEAAPSTSPSNKRKLTSSSPPEKRKKRKTPILKESQNLMALLEKLPSGDSLSGTLHFLVEPETAGGLESLDKSLIKTLGIETIRKMKGIDRYTIEISDLSKFHEFYKQHHIASMPYDTSSESNEEATDYLVPFLEEMPYPFEMDTLPSLPAGIPSPVDSVKSDSFDTDSFLSLPEYYSHESQNSGAIVPVSPTALQLCQWGLFGSHAKETSEMELDNKDGADKLGNNATKPDSPY